MTQKQHATYILSNWNIYIRLKQNSYLLCCFDDNEIILRFTGIGNVVRCSLGSLYIFIVNTIRSIFVSYMKRLLGSHGRARKLPWFWWEFQNGSHPEVPITSCQDDDRITNWYGWALTRLTRKASTLVPTYFLLFLPREPAYLSMQILMISRYDLQIRVWYWPYQNYSAQT